MCPSRVSCSAIHSRAFFKNFFNQPKDIQQKILDYKLTVYVCEGEPSEKLEWFKTINIAGKPLNEQEINNAVYAGPFVSDAKNLEAAGIPTIPAITDFNKASG